MTKLEMLEKVEEIKEQNKIMRAKLEEEKREELTEEEETQLDADVKEIAKLERSIKNLEKLDIIKDSKIAEKEVIRSVETKVTKDEKDKMTTIELIKRGIEEKSSIVISSDVLKAESVKRYSAKTDVQGTYEDRPIADGLFDNSVLMAAGMVYEVGYSELNYPVFGGITGITGQAQGSTGTATITATSVKLSPADYAFKITIPRRAYNMDATGSIAKAIERMRPELALAVERDLLAKTDATDGVPSLYAAAALSKAAFGAIDHAKMLGLRGDLGKKKANVAVASFVMSFMNEGTLLGAQSIATRFASELNLAGDQQISTLANTSNRVFASTLVDYDDAFMFADFTKAVVAQYGDITLVVDDITDAGNIFLNGHANFGAAWMDANAALNVTGVA